MGKRFEYRAMTPEELQSDLDSIGMPEKAFCRIFGVEPKRLGEMLAGTANIPNWVPVMLQLLKNVPGALPEARQAAAERIVRDHLRPQDGEYPYLAKGDQE